MFKTLLLSCRNAIRKVFGKRVVLKDTINIQTMEEKQRIQEEIQALNAQLTGDMFQDMDLKDKIHNLQMQLDGVRPMDSYIECVGCGS